MTAPRGAQTVERAFALLEIVGAAGSMRLSQLAEESGLTLPTTHRLVAALAARGYLQSDGDRRWSLGPQAAWLGSRAEQHRAQRARPDLRALVEATGETASLAALQDDEVVYLTVAPSPHALRSEPAVGARVLPHCTAVGKVLLAQLPEERARQILARTGLPRLTERTVVDANVLLAELKRIRRLGYAVDVGEQEAGVRCVAAPLEVPGAGPSAVSVSGPALRFGGSPEELRAVGETVRQTATALTSTT